MKNRSHKGESINKCNKRERIKEGNKKVNMEGYPYIL
jgi:hypothetical protein